MKKKLNNFDKNFKIYIKTIATLFLMVSLLIENIPMLLFTIGMLIICLHDD